MNPQIVYVIVASLGGIGIIVLLVFLIPVLVQVRKTAQQFEVTAATLEKVLDQDFRELLDQGEKVLQELEDLPPWVKDKLARFPSERVLPAMPLVGGSLGRTLFLWALRGGWQLFKKK
ncbi:MAG TPA: DUF948 domain-containing protein [Thermodesulfobacteriota bacterium]|nr:DUF948 domain-containing protein [Deltaproteobacteria bacterium]HNR12002.1 DUF948 domain-containing protein [Thermodesulfobacteriota bacterium]HOC37896.1 DUF948 domain-containing protein [Thermodesulfobacteriota bacterium]HQO78023.1 DUF948 domain-containing protein [Thermodesulfobacteriota bacterium]